MWRPETGATPYDIPGAEPFSHDGELCSFDAFLKHYQLRESALQTLALIVRGADTARHDLTPQSAGLHAISLGLSANFPDDHAMLEQAVACGLRRPLHLVPGPPERGAQLEAIGCLRSRRGGLRPAA